MKLKYTQYVDTDEPVMLVNKHIGHDEEDGDGIMGPQFQEELMYLDTLGKKRIKVFICSPGGNVVDAMQMYNAILATKTKVDTFNTGVAASSAGVVFQAGRTRYMSDYALLMMHNPFSPGATGSTPELESFKNSLVKMLGRKNPTATEESISDFMNNTTWMDADACVKNGFCDVIEHSSDMNKPRAISTDPKATWKQYANYFNSLNTNPPIQNTMKKVYNKLKINENSTEDVMVAAIDAIENRATTAELEKEKLKKELETANTNLVEVQNKVTDLENKAAELKETEDAEKVTALENAATLLVENAAKVGKIKNDAATILKIKAQAIKDFEGTKELIDSMPLNKKGANIVNKDDTGAPVPRYTMGAVMIGIQNKSEGK
ncbi:MAG: Clp protease ClpP [Bacteroidota bacterium]